MTPRARRVVLGCALAAFGAGRAGADQLDVNLDDDAPKQMQMAVGDGLAILLPVNPSTGAVWAIMGEQGLIAQSQPPRFEVARPMPGASGHMVFNLIGVRSGTTVLHFTLRQQGAGSSTPVTKELHLDVR